MIGIRLIAETNFGVMLSHTFSANDADGQHGICRFRVNQSRFFANRCHSRPIGVIKRARYVHPTQFVTASEEIVTCSDPNCLQATYQL